MHPARNYVHLGESAVHKRRNAALDVTKFIQKKAWERRTQQHSEKRKTLRPPSLPSNRNRKTSPRRKIRSLSNGYINAEMRNSSCQSKENDLEVPYKFDVEGGMPSIVLSRVHLYSMDERAVSGYASGDTYCAMGRGSPHETEGRHGIQPDFRKPHGMEDDSAPQQLAVHSSLQQGQRRELRSLPYVPRQAIFGWE